MELEDYQGKLTKLVQTDTVMEYQEAFEYLSNKVDGLSKSFLLSCFISSLKPHIQHEIASFQPTSLTKAMALTKIQEHKLFLKHNPPKLFSPYPPFLANPIPNQTNSSTYTSKPVNTSISTVLFSNGLTTNTTNTQPKPMIQKLSQSQIQAKRDEGLCFYYDEKYTIGDKCRASTHVLIVPDSEELILEDVNEGESLQEQEEGNEVIDTPQISLHAMSGILMPQTLKFKGSIRKLSVQILVDGGSTHNFLQSRVVSMLNLKGSSKR